MDLNHLLPVFLVAIFSSLFCLSFCEDELDEHGDERTLEEKKRIIPYTLRGMSISREAYSWLTAAYGADAMKEAGVKPAKKRWYAKRHKVNCCIGRSRPMVKDAHSCLDFGGRCCSDDSVYYPVYRYYGKIGIVNPFPIKKHADTSRPCGQCFTGYSTRCVIR